MCRATEARNAPAVKFVISDNKKGRRVVMAQKQKDKDLRGEDSDVEVNVSAPDNNWWLDLSAS